MVQKLIYTHDVDGAIEDVCRAGKYDRCFVLCDEHTARWVLPQLASQCIKEASLITIAAGDVHKDLDTLAQVWRALSEGGATRHSLLVNVGGGMVTDLGGFAAATFKRGMSFVNVPTTLLGAVDAAVGGKTGINFAGLKNEVGAFAEALAVIISTRFFHTLQREELLSGYAEMIKHGLIAGEVLYNPLLQCDVTTCSDDALLEMLQASVEVKRRIVASDLHEAHLRKTLNLGHTMAHAFESHAMHHGNPIPHGYAVAWGVVCELILSHRLLSLPSSVVYDLAHYVEKYYGAYAITCDDYDELCTYMQHDKKNEGDTIRFTLLRKMGCCEVNVPVERREIEIALDFYRDLFHL